MEEEIIWTSVAQKDFWEISEYLKESWPPQVLNNFHHALKLKTELLQKQPFLGSKSGKFSRFRKVLITRHYILIYSVKKQHVIIHRLKHASMK